jgi:cytochrome c-type biogenesis protein CcmF
MTVLGQWVVLAALAASCGSAFFYGRAAGRTSSLRLARALLDATLALVVLAAVLLTVLLLSHDFTNGYVFSYSDRSLPLHFLLSSFYAGQEGSFLFWSLCAVIIALPLARFTRRHGSEAWVMAAFMAVQAALLVLVAVKSPFRPLWVQFPDAPVGFVPADGRGLNPLLQNFWMVIHPPVLFLGFAAMGAPFALAIAGLWKRDGDILVAQALPWVLLSTAVLGAGIMLGGYWAYGVLGWGGYWGWDPVENSSLIPWITGMALVHTLLAQLRTGKFRRTNFALAIGSFFLIIYSTFLTRSGILGDASVHSFTDPGAGIYWLLVAFLGLIVLAGLVLLARTWRAWAPAPGPVLWLSRETLLGAGAIVLLLSAAVILFGTSLPIFSTTRVEPSFYDRSNLPIAILIGLLIAASLYTQWEAEDLAWSVRRGWRSFLAAFLATAIVIAVGVQDPLLVALAFASFFTLWANVEIGWTVAKGDPLFLGGKVAHIGLALFLLGVLSSGRYTTTEHLRLPPGQMVPALGGTMTYTGSTPLPGNKFGFRVTVEHEGSRFVLMPVMFETPSSGIMRNPDIASTFTRDFYLSPVSLENQEAAGAESTVVLERSRTTQLGDAQVTFERFDMTPHGGAGENPAGGMPIGAVLTLSRGGRTETLTPVTVFRPGAAPTYREAVSVLLDGPVRLAAVSAGMPSTVTLVLPGGGGHVHQEVLVVEASVKPFIGAVWVGTIVMMIGFGLAVGKRLKEVRA